MNVYPSYMAYLSAHVNLGLYFRINEWWWWWWWRPLVQKQYETRTISNVLKQNNRPAKQKREVTETLEPNQHWSTIKSSICQNIDNSIIVSYVFMIHCWILCVLNSFIFFSFHSNEYIFQLHIYRESIEDWII